MTLHLLIERARVGNKGEYLLRARCGEERTFKGAMPEDFTGWASLVTCWVCSGGSPATQPQEQPQAVPAAQPAAQKPAGRPAPPQPKREAAAAAQGGSGICPVCNRAIAQHNGTERKVCHDAVSGWSGRPSLADQARAAFSMERLVRVVLPHAVYAVVAVNGIITETAPIGKWAKGMRLHRFCTTIQRQGGQVELL